MGVRVTAGPHVLDAAHVVLAVPPPTLRPVTFDPPLGPDAAAMVAELGLGPALKVARQFGHRFWTAAGWSGFTVADLPFHVAWDATDSMPGPSGILTQFVTGDAARRGAALAARRRIGWFGTQLARVYPEGRALAMDNVATMAWHDEPFTTGGYTVYRPGQLTRFFPVLRRAVGPIWFAGEHTETMAGYMESAVRSGQRVAASIGPPAPA